MDIFDKNEKCIFPEKDIRETLNKLGFEKEPTDKSFIEDDIIVSPVDGEIPCGDFPELDGDCPGPDIDVTDGMFPSEFPFEDEQILRGDIDGPMPSDQESDKDNSK